MLSGEVESHFLLLLPFSPPSLPSPLILPLSYFCFMRIDFFFFFLSSFWLFFIESHYTSSLPHFRHISLLPHYCFLILSPSISIQTRARQRIQAAQLYIDASAPVGVKEQTYLWPLWSLHEQMQFVFSPPSHWTHHPLSAVRCPAIQGWWPVKVKVGSHVLFKLEIVLFPIDFRMLEEVLSKKIQAENWPAWNLA